MKAVLIDDEPLALLGLQIALKDYSMIQIVGSYQSPQEAIRYVQSHSDVDVVFLDIDMPAVTGLVVAEKLKECAASPNIIFITAHNHYAVEAFELHAMDYLLKPLNKGRLNKTIDRLMQNKASMLAEKVAVSVVSVSFVRQLQFYLSNGERLEVKWRTAKTQEMMAYLLLRRDEFIHRDQLIELMWPAVKLDKAIQLLHTTVYNLRLIAKKHQIPIQVEYVNDCYKLQSLMVHRDMDANQLSEQQRIAMLDRYPGDFLQDCGYMWAEQEAVRLRRRWVLDALLKIKQLKSEGLYEHAMDWYEKLTEVEPYTEKYYEEWMACCLEIGNMEQLAYVRTRMDVAFQDIGL